MTTTRATSKANSRRSRAFVAAGVAIVALTATTGPVGAATLDDDAVYTVDRRFPIANLDTQLIKTDVKPAPLSGPRCTPVLGVAASKAAALQVIANGGGVAAQATFC